MSSSEILEQRAHFEWQIARRTLCDALRDVAAEHGDQPAPPPWSVPPGNLSGACVIRNAARR
jgi:hypothetical protein